MNFAFPGNASGREIARGLGKLLSIVCCGLILVVTGFAASDSPPSKPCTKSPDVYRGFTVNAVRIVTPLSIRTPLSFLFGSQEKLQDEFDALIPQLPLKKGEPFDRVANSFSTDKIRERYDEMVVRPGERIRFAFVTYRLEQCDEVAQTLEVTYLVYSSEFLYHLSRIFERPSDRITRSMAPGRITNSDSLANTANKLLPQPFLGYDRARKTIVGSKASFETNGGVLDHVAFDGSGSPNSAMADFNLAGSRDSNEGFFSHVNWRMAYNYFNLPSDPNTLKGATGVAQLFAATRPVGRREVTFRFGSSFEAGNRQSDLPVPINVPSIAERLGYGALKAYLGATASRGRRSWMASYGVQLSSDGDDAGLAYVKHVFDAGYRLRYLLREHRPLRIEAQFTAGAIQTHNALVPVSERFFGGNRIRPFIEGDDWVINTNPLIRSFPQNELNLIGPNAAVGGERFFSANLTISHPVWNFPAVPDEISQEPIVRDALGGQLRTARQATVQSYIAEEPEYRTVYELLLGDSAQLTPDNVRGNLAELSQTLAQVQQMVDALGQRPNLPADVSSAIEELSDDPDFGSDLLGDSKGAIEEATTNKGAFKAKARELIVGFNSVEGLIPRLITSLTKLSGTLRTNSLTAEAQQVERSNARFKKIQELMEVNVAKLVKIGEVKLDVFQPTLKILNVEGGEDVNSALKQIRAVLARVGERANTISSVGRAALLTTADLKNPRSLAATLKAMQDPVSTFLTTQFSAGTRDLLKNQRDNEPASPALVQAMIEELNRVISGPSIFSEDRFTAIDLSDEIESLAARNPQGAELISLNRSLLAAAYSREIRKSQLDESLEPLSGYINDAETAMEVINDPESSDADAVRGVIHQLVVGYGELAPSVVNSIDSHIRKLAPVLKSIGLTLEAQELAAQAQKLTNLQRQARKTFTEISLSRSEQQAERDIAFAARSLDVIFREINLVEIAPLVAVDVARIGPAVSPGFGKVHYAVGPGVRFSLVTLDFTAGYAFNLNRQPNERRGSLIFSMTISDLFR